MIYQAAIFDMDGTLLDSERVCLECFNEVGARYGLADLTPVFMQIVGRSGMTEEKIITAGLEGRVPFQTFVTAWDEELQQAHSKGVPVKDGAVELLTLLQDAGLPMAVATSTRHDNARAHLEHAGLLGFFDHVVGGDQVTHRKPDPEPYLKVASLLGVDPKLSVMFEDSGPGTEAAVRAGGVVVQVPDLKAPDPDIVAFGHVIAPSLLEGAKEIGLI